MDSSSSEQIQSLDTTPKLGTPKKGLPEELHLQFTKSPTNSEMGMIDGAIYSGRTATPIMRRVADCRPQEPGLKLLEGYRSLFIKRKVKGSWFGSTMISHSVYPLGPKGDKVKGTKLFKSIEKVGWCTFSVGPHDTEVVYKSKHDPLLDNALYMTFERRDECDFFCMDRVPLRVNVIQNDEKCPLGRVVQHSDCCEFREWKFDVVDNSGEIKYVIRQESFRAKSMNIEDFGGKKVGVINYVMKSSCFQVKFPKKASGADKALIFAAILEVSHTAYDKRWK